MHEKVEFLERLAAMWKAGALSDAEFHEQKQAVLTSPSPTPPSDASIQLGGESALTSVVRGKKGIAIGVAAILAITALLSIVTNWKSGGQEDANPLASMADTKPKPNAANGEGIFPYVDISEVGSLKMFGRSAELQQVLGGKDASIIFSPSQTVVLGDEVKMIDGSDGLTCTVSASDYAPVAARTNPWLLVQGKFGLFPPEGEVEIENCQIITLDGPQWEQQLKAGKFPNVARVRTSLSD